MQGVVLAQYPFAEQGRQALYGVDFITQHLAQRDAGPAADHLSNGAAIDQRMHQRLVALHTAQLFTQRGDFVGIGRFAWRGVEGLEALDQRQLLLPLLLQARTLLLLDLQGFLQRGQAACVVVAFTGFLLQYGNFCLQVVDLALAVFQRAGLRGLRQGDARTGGIEHADRLVRQLAASDVAVGQTHRLHQGFVHHRDLVVLLHFAEQTAEHIDSFIFVWLFDFDDLKAAGQGGVLLEVLFVLGPGGRRDGAQLTAGQGWLEQVGGVVLPGLAT
ncbi:hypothetical protein D3C80_1014210 [compost metagenome]